MMKPFLLFAIVAISFLQSSCAQTNVTKEQAIAIAEKHVRQYSHYPSTILRVEAETGEGSSNQYWERFDQEAIQGKKQICWVVRFYYSGSGIDGQLLVFVDKSNGDAIGGTKTR